MSRSTSAKVAISVSSSSATGAPAVAGVGALKGVGPLEGVAWGPRDGEEKGKEEGVMLSSAPERKKPSKRPETRISHSASLMAAKVARMLWRGGLERR